MNRPVHGTAHRREQRICALFDELRPEHHFTLTYNKFSAFYFQNLCSEISGKAVFASLPPDNSNNSCKMKGSKRDIRSTEHQRTARETALCPCIFFRKRISPVTLNISCPIAEKIPFPVERQFPADCVTHAYNAVSAFHKRNKAKRSHDVVANRRKSSESDASFCGAVCRVHPQPDSVSSKIIFPYINMKTMPASVKFAAGETDCPGTLICNDLNRAGFLIPRLMKGGNQCNSPGFRLALKIPSAEIVIHHIITSFPVIVLTPERENMQKRRR